jgi:hypothetical protein
MNQEFLKEEIMPTDSCVFLYVENMGRFLDPQLGDCCVNYSIG